MICNLENIVYETNGSCSVGLVDAFLSSLHNNERPVGYRAHILSFIDLKRLFIVNFFWCLTILAISGKYYSSTNVYVL